MNETVQIPKGWELKKISDICNVDTGYAFKSNNFQTKGIPLIRIGNIQNDKITLKNNTVFLDKKLVEKHQKFVVEKNQILIALSGATTGKSAIYDKNETVFLNQRVGRIKFLKENLILQQFVYYFIKKIGIELLKKSHGGAQPNISPKLIENFEIMIPLDDQITYKIVQKLDDIFNQLEEKKNKIFVNQNHLEKSEELLLSIKQNILKNAFTGKLTESKKFPNSINYPDHISKKMNESLKKKQIKSIKYSDEPVNTSELFTIPSNWIWVKLGKLTYSMKNGIYKSSDNYGAGIPCLRMYNINQDGKINLDKIKLMKLTDNEKIDYGLEHNDLLLNRVNSKELVGKTAIIENKYDELIFESKNIRIRMWSSFVNPIYVNYWLQSKWIRNNIEKNCKQTCGMATINQPFIAELPIPLPSYEEQNEIIKKIINLQKSTNTVKKTLSEIIHSINNIRSTYPKIQNSILDSAFSGKLIQ